MKAKFYMQKCFNNLSISSYVRLATFIERHQALTLFLLSSCLVFFGAAEHVSAQDPPGGGGGGGGLTGGYRGVKYGEICKRILEMHAKGGYGALLTSLAGIGAILASAMGGFKAAWSLLVVAIGSFLLNSYRTLFFGESCGGPFKG